MAYQSFNLKECFASVILLRGKSSGYSHCSSGRNSPAGRWNVHNIQLRFHRSLIKLIAWQKKRLKMSNDMLVYYRKCSG